MKSPARLTARLTARMATRLTVRTSGLVAAIGLALVASACGSSDSGSDSSSGSGGDRTLTVLAAASLTETFTDLKKSFEAEHDGVTVKLVFDSSAALAKLAEEGAPGDVLATADKKTMDEAQANEGTSGSAEQFATNVVTLAVPKANPADITSFADLSRSGVKYVTCVTTAPCGAAAEKLLASNQVSAKPVSQETDVKAVLAKITANEADAGFVYATDVKAAGDAVTGLEVPGASADPNTYWVAVTKQAEQEGLAKDWIELMTSADGQKVLTDAGFGAPAS